MIASYERMLARIGAEEFECRVPYPIEHREDGFAITVGLMEYISGWSALEILYWLHEKQAIPRRYDNARRQ